MKMFQYHRPSDIASALELFQKNEGAHYIAGATNLLDLMKKDIAAPDHVIDISRLPLQEVKNVAGGIQIGALALNSTVAEHPEIVSKYPLIAQALAAGASQQLRNMATMGGNLLQRTRCPYFYDTALPCNKRQPGSGCPAKDGVSHLTAIFGASDNCVAVHPSDLCVALSALDAQVHIKSVNGSREIPFNDFLLLPGNTPEKAHALEKGALITGIFIPENPFARHYHYLKVRDRASYSFALVSVAVALQVKDSIITDARIALGGVAMKPWRATEAEAFLKGKTDAANYFKQAAALAVKGAQPVPSSQFKVNLVENAVFTAFMSCFG